MDLAEKPRYGITRDPSLVIKILYWGGNVKKNLFFLKIKKLTKNRRET